MTDDVECASKGDTFMPAARKMKELRLRRSCAP